MVKIIVTLAALFSQAVSAAGAGFVLCISHEGWVRLEVEGAPCTLCQHDHDDDACCEAFCEAPLGEPRPPTGLPGFSQVCDCVHLGFSCPGTISFVPVEKTGYHVGWHEATPLPAFAKPIEIAAPGCFHDPPLLEFSLPHLVILSSVKLRC